MTSGLAARQAVGVAQLRVSDALDEVLVAYALGSCLGVAVYDPLARVGGLLHVMLPSATIDPEKAAHNPSMFVDTGVPRLFRECYKLGAHQERIVVKVAGGASTQLAGSQDIWEIGKRNLIALRQLLWKNGVLLHGYDVGGSRSRTMTLDIATGEVTVSSGGSTIEL